MVGETTQATIPRLLLVNPEHAFIVDYVRQFGPRRAGSAAETAAHRHFQQQMACWMHTVREHAFEAPLRAKFHSLKVFCVLYALALGLFWLSPWAAFALGFANAVSLALNFVLFRPFIEGLYRKHASRNSIGVLEPAGPAKQTIILCGHMDSTPEFIWWYRLGHWGGPVMVGAIAQQLAYPLAMLAVALAAPASASSAWGWGHTVWAVFAGLSPLCITLFNVHGKRVVPGAQDNLSGVSVAYHTAQAIANSGQPLQHTRLLVVAFGAEEGGLLGSRAFVRAHAADLHRADTTVVNLDGILDAGQLHLIAREPNSRVRYCRRTLAALQSAFAAEGVPVRQATLPIGATDAAYFARRGIRAATIVGMGMGRLHFTYHTRHDVPLHVQPEALANLRRVLVRFVRNADAGE